MRHFEQELEQLKGKLLEMSALVESAIYRSVQGVVDKNQELAEQVIKNEARVNQLEIEIDDMAISLLALQAPLAADLRLVTAAIKINNDLERMGDLSVSIAQSALALMKEPMIRPLIDIPHIAGLAQGMVRKALDAFVNRDTELARSVLASDDAVDNMRTASYHELISFMEKNPQQISQALYLLSTVRNLERIADHATNIAEDVLFLVKGVDVRHHNEDWATVVQS
ncbi:MAG: phosphate signaling complex protein PhoU [Acidobacteriaceae bacterium]|nr:phosphate signaling complex protein PhoU [Acidobacteriaceae bacterium]MBV9038140.1 phosphate signaling complex protein PhoU [Acidobacteriaceae bacterium]MBV9224171.1 phosphate signaling complex protein PhoU [Acidobacteriaceae bacterium]